MTLDNPWAAALGWTLLHSLWQGAIAASLLAVVLLATKSPRIRYVAGCSAMLALFIAFAVTLANVAPELGQTAIAHHPAPFAVWKDIAFAHPTQWQVTLSDIAPWLAPLWMIGVSIFYLRYTIGWFSLARLRRRGLCAAQHQWQQTLAELSAKLRISRTVSLFESALAEVPMVIGHIRPLILMPIGLFSGMPTAQIEAILLHELAHIRRHDFLINALQNLLDGLFFYHPAAWWISHVIRAEREKCCDDLVVQISGNAHQYACALAALEQLRWAGREPALAAKGGSLMNRIHRLLYPKAPHAGWTPLLATGLLLVTIAVTLGAWQPTQPPPLAHVTTDAYNKWLNEDVVYIIDDAERAAFSKLTTNEERNHFVEQFWDRRNPDGPGARENKFKVEHYRRIAFANQHFATASGSPGWQTDRGHMYILYGPPDEIDSHPSGPPHPWERWGYKDIENASQMNFFRFVDIHGTGDFRLSPSSEH